jgi:acyl-CoA reductase-like NAD-dependent aldehyde dehydrogenase
MFAVARELAAMTEEIAELECRDNGKTLANGRNEVALTVRYLEYYGGLADKLEGRQIPLGAGIVDYTVHAPFGVSAQIVPWNGPLPVGARSVCCALVTGNSVVLKSPEDSPLSLIKFAEACQRAGVPRGAFNLICGYGPEAGAALAGHRDIDHIVFTGSVETGKSVLRAAAVDPAHGGAALRPAASRRHLGPRAAQPGVGGPVHAPLPSGLARPAALRLAAEPASADGQARALPHSFDLLLVEAPAAHGR